jgi:hypothetical protein
MYKKRTLATGIVLAVSIAICVWPVYSEEKDRASLNTSKNLSGAWKTNFADLFLTQSGNNVTGSYKYEGGKLKGTITGDQLDYTWTQTNGKKGKGYFVLSDDGKSISGRYGYNDDNSSAGEWKGRKVEAPAPAK